MTDRQWIIAEQESAGPKTLAGLPPVLANILWRRGYRTPDEMKEYLHPDYRRQLADPFSYRGMADAVDRIRQAIVGGQRITVYGDYDVDGMTASAIVLETVQALGGTAVSYIPERLSEGYGLNLQAIEKIAADGTKLLIAVDCGTTNVQEIARAKELGLTVIVLDHHHEPDVRPPADVIINPAFADQTYPFRNHSSGGVAFSLARALVQANRTQMLPAKTMPVGWEKWLLDLAAISTVADLTPLRGENRVFVKYGLQVLRQTRRPGLRALLDQAGRELATTDEHTIGFQIAPRLNAAGRLHRADIGLELLLTKDRGRAAELAGQLQRLNTDRQRLTELAVAEAMEQVVTQGAQEAYVAFAPHWSPGIIGLVAGRIVERVWRPVLVMTENGGEIIGSGRSVPDFNIMDVFDAGRHHFSRFGGHPGACGFTLASADQREAFTAWFTGYVQTTIAPAEARPLAIDATVSLADFTPEVLDGLETMAPFGIGNERPAFLLQQLTIERLSTVGNTGQHIRLTVKQNGTSANLIGFRFGAMAAQLAPGTVIDAVVEASWNSWQGRREPQMKILDLREAS